MRSTISTSYFLLHFGTFIPMHTLSDLFQSYPSYHIAGIEKRWLRPQDLIPLLDQVTHTEAWQKIPVGTSAEGRQIHAYQWGNGPTKHLLWSQMHGDESTATRALVDVMHFLSVSDSFNPLRNKLQKSLTLVFVPMLNPDGSERFTRRNAQGLDPNRDARDLQTPELKALVSFARSFEPKWAWNLHDQRNFYSCGKAFIPANMSFLAPAEKQGLTSANRLEAMQLLALVMNHLEQTHNCHVGRYTEEYYPLAVGEFFQEMGISTLLVESGHAPYSPSREWQRQLNFESILLGFESSISLHHKSLDVQNYYAFPELGKKFLDCIVRRIELPLGGYADLGLMYKLVPQADGSLLQEWVVEELGDLRNLQGFEEWNHGPYSVNSTSLPGIGEVANLTLISKNGDKQHIETKPWIH